MKDALTTGEVGRILGISTASVCNLMGDSKLRGWVIPGTKERRMLLSEVVRYLKDKGLPRAPLLSFLENNGATYPDLEHFNIEELIGIGQIRLHPKKHYILKTGDLAELSGVSSKTAGEWVDERLLKGYKLPTNGEDRRATVDDYLRFALQNGMPIEGKELETKTTLLVEYPGKWMELNKMNSEGSLWYKYNKTMQEISIRDGEDGLYVSKYDNNIFALILLGMTGREEPGQIVHSDHIGQIDKFLEQGKESARHMDRLDLSGVILENLQQAQEHLHENYQIAVKTQSVAEKITQAVVEKA